MDTNFKSKSVSFGGHHTNISEEEKIRIASDFILHAPPGESSEVFNDTRALVNNDKLFKDSIGPVFAKYNCEQMTPVKLKNSDHVVLVTEHNEIGSCLYYDPRSKQSFRYDHIRKIASDYQPYIPDASLEYYRAPLESELDAYVSRHYQNGVCSVFATRQQPKGILLTACIEGHNYQPENFWNGCWRSLWQLKIVSKTVTAHGDIKVQVHYYEDGNVQLVTSKNVQENIFVSIKEQIVKEFVKLIGTTECNFQKAINLNFKSMSDTTFKALRRMLPVTRDKIDWNKILTYTIGKELKKD